MELAGYLKELPSNLIGDLTRNISWRMRLWFAVMMTAQLGTTLWSLVEYGETTRFLTVLSFVYGISTVICIFLVSLGRKTGIFPWAIISSTSLILQASTAWAVGDFIGNVFGLLMMILSIYTWNKAGGKDDRTVESKTLSVKQWLIIIGGLLASLPIIYLLSHALVEYKFGVENIQFFAGPFGRIFSDSFVPGITIIANVLMMAKYKEQWYLWLVLDIVEVIYWTQYAVVSIQQPHLLEIAGIGMPIVVSTLAIWLVQLINALVGTYQWSRKAKLGAALSAGLESAR